MNLKRCNMNKKIFFIFLVLIVQLTSYAKPTIILLRGLPCSGKSTLCDELLTIDPSWKILNEDDFYDSYMDRRLSEEFPKEYKRLEQVIEQKNIINYYIF